MTIFLAYASLLETIPFGLEDKIFIFIVCKGKMKNYSELFYSLELVD